MRILYFFISLVYTASVLEHIRQQGQQIYGSLARQASSLRDLGAKKLSNSANSLKETVGKVKEKITRKKEVKDEIPEDFELDSTMLKEFLEQLSRQFEDFKKTQDEENKKSENEHHHDHHHHEHDHHHDAASEDEDKSRKETL